MPIPVNRSFSIANAGTTTSVSLPLKRQGDTFPAWLTRVIVEIPEAVTVVDAATFPTGDYATQGPIWAEVLLLRDDGSFLLLDKGFMMNGPLAGDHSTLTSFGRLSLRPEDKVVVNIRNDSTFTASSIIRIAVETIDVNEIPDRNVLDGWNSFTVPHKQTAVWLYIEKDTLGSVAGDIELAWVTRAGSTSRFFLGSASRNSLGSVAVTNVFYLQDATQRNIYQIATAAVSAGGFSNIPNLFGSAGVLTATKSHSFFDTKWIGAEVSASYIMALLFEYQGAIPYVTRSTPAAFTFSVMTNEVR